MDQLKKYKFIAPLLFELLCLKDIAKVMALLSYYWYIYCEAYQSKSGESIFLSLTYQPQSKHNIKSRKLGAIFKSVLNFCKSSIARHNYCDIGLANPTSLIFSHLFYFSRLKILTLELNRASQHVVFTPEVFKVLAPCIADIHLIDTEQEQLPLNKEQVRCLGLLTKLESLYLDCFSISSWVDIRDVLGLIKNSLVSLTLECCNYGSSLDSNIEAVAFSSALLSISSKLIAVDFSRSYCVAAGLELSLFSTTSAHLFQQLRILSLNSDDEPLYEDQVSEFDPFYLQLNLKSIECMCIHLRHLTTLNLKSKIVLFSNPLVFSLICNSLTNLTSLDCPVPFVTKEEQPFTAKDCILHLTQLTQLQHLELFPLLLPGRSIFPPFIPMQQEIHQINQTERNERLLAYQLCSYDQPAPAQRYYMHLVVELGESLLRKIPSLQNFSTQILSIDPSDSFLYMLMTRETFEQLQLKYGNDLQSLQ